MPRRRRPGASASSVLAQAKPLVTGTQGDEVATGVQSTLGTEDAAAVASKIVSAAPIKTGLWGAAPTEVVDSRLRSTPLLQTKAECEQVVLPLAAVDLRADLEAVASPPDVDTISSTIGAAIAPLLYPWSSTSTSPPSTPLTPVIAHEEIPETPEIEAEDDNGTWSDSIDTDALLRSMISQDRLRVDVKGRHIIDNSFVEYAIEVTEQPSATLVVAVYRRYQDFASLNADLASLRRANNGSAPLPKFPPKSGIPKLFSQWRNDAFLNTRQQQLAEYLQRILQLCSSEAERSRIADFLSPSS